MKFSMKPQSVIYPASLAFALAGCSDLYRPAFDGPEVMAAIEETTSAQKGVCPKQAFVFIADSHKVYNNGVAQVETVNEDGSGTMKVSMREGRFETSRTVTFDRRQVALKPPSECGYKSR